MKVMIYITAVLLGVSASWAAVDEDIGKLKSDYERSREGLLEEYARKAGENYASLIQSLENLRDEAEKKGNAEESAAVRGEIERIQKDKALLGETLDMKARLIQQGRRPRARPGVEPERKDKPRPRGDAQGPEAAAPETKPREPEKAPEAGNRPEPKSAVGPAPRKRAGSSLGCEITVSSTHYGEPGESAPAALVDGDLFTRWSSAYTAPQQIVLSLAKPTKLGKMRLHWEKACATRYSVFVSQDRKTWSPVYFFMNNDVPPESRQDEIALKDIPASSVKLDLQSCVNTNWGFSLYEIELVPAE